MDKCETFFEVFKGKIRRPVSLLKSKKAYVNLLSVYDMLICEKLAQTLTLKLVNEGFEQKQALTVAENACLCLMCLTDYNSYPIFEDTTELINRLTAEDMLCVVKEYRALRKDYLGFDVVDDFSLEKLKKN